MSVDDHYIEKLIDISKKNAALKKQEENNQLTPEARASILSSEMSPGL